MKSYLILLSILLLLPSYIFAQKPACLSGNTFHYPKKFVIISTMLEDQQKYYDTIFVEYDSKMRPARIQENNMENFVTYDAGIHYTENIDLPLKDGIPQYAVLAGGFTKPAFVYNNCNLTEYSFVSIRPEFSWLHLDYKATLAYDETKLNSLPFLFYLKGVAIDNGALGFNPCSFLYPHNKNLVSKITVVSRTPEYTATEYDEDAEEEYEVKIDAGPEEVSNVLFDYTWNTRNQISKVKITTDTYIEEYLLEY